MFLKSIWQRFNPRPTHGESVSLTPVEQLTMRFLLNYGQAPRESIQTEVASTRITGESEVNDALARLVSHGLVQTTSRGDERQLEALYYSSKKGTRLEGNIPVEPQTVTEFYL